MEDLFTFFILNWPSTNDALYRLYFKKRRRIKKTNAYLFFLFFFWLSAFEKWLARCRPADDVCRVGRRRMAASKRGVGDNTFEGFEKWRKRGQPFLFFSFFFFRHCWNWKKGGKELGRKEKANLSLKYWIKKKKRKWSAPGACQKEDRTEYITQSSGTPWHRSSLTYLL